MFSFFLRVDVDAENVKYGRTEARYSAFLTMVEVFKYF